MNKYEEKLKVIEQHLETHPHDWQSKVSWFKNNSKRIEYERFLAEVRKKQIHASINRGKL